jgi:hypothetical protein
MDVTLDLDPLTHDTFFYVYHPEMTCDSQAVCNRYADPVGICNGCAAKGMPCSNGLECCWGNRFAPSPAVALPKDRWTCVELVMRANDPGQANGQAAYRIDGREIHRISGIRWRDADTLQLNMVRLQHYITSEDALNRSNRVWFDDVVVSTQPIGCD